MTAKIDPAQLPGLLSQLPGWSLDASASAISRHLEFADFNEAFAFMARASRSRPNGATTIRTGRTPTTWST